MQWSPYMLTSLALNGSELADVCVLPAGLRWVHTLFPQKEKGAHVWW